MGKYWLNVVLFRVILPITLGGCALWRPTLLSLVYMGLMVYLPMVPVPTNATMKGITGRFLKSAISLSFLATLTQLAFHIVVLALPPYGHFLENCKFLEKLFRHFGLVRLDGVGSWEVFFWLLPELVVLPISIIIYILCRRLTYESPHDDDEPIVKKDEASSSKITKFLGIIGTYVVLASLCCTAVLVPCIPGAFYFLVFLGATTYWACNKELRRGFAVLCRIVMFVAMIQLLVLCAYQNQWPQEWIPPDSIWARYFGLVRLYVTDCSNPKFIKFSDFDWTVICLPMQLLWLYYVLALQSQFLIRKPAKKGTRFSGKLENLDTPLSRHVSVRRRTPSQRWQSARRKARETIESTHPDEKTPLMRFGSGRAGLLQDSTGSVIVQDGQNDDSIQLQNLNDVEPEDQPGICEHIIMAVYSVMQLVVRSSYLATNIVMMTWSITYHSWVTFVLLLWALILWMVPNKRSSMMRCSPFIVTYATLLLLVQYVFFMDLTDEELPTNIYNVELKDIGFRKTQDMSHWHLIVKCVFTTMFWVTMRQYMSERNQQSRSSALRDMVAPLHVTMSTATTAMNKESPEMKSKFMEDVGALTKKLLTKFWIAVVAIMLFTSGITGERMTVFRIIYMSLFLFFLITFQISWFAWRKMMYGFWVTVIGYSIIMLILVYTYQFDNFETYWENISIKKELQMDIGLEKYAIKDLFVRLLTPTFFVIITVVQIHYFHDDFLEATNIETLKPSIPSRRDSLGRTASSVPSPMAMNIHDTGEPESTMYTLKQLKQMSKIERMALLQSILTHVVNFYNYIWLFLELHMQKIIFMSIILLCMHDVCAINFFFVVTIVIVINFKRNIQVMSINVMSAVIAMLMVVKMLYQIDYIQHTYWDVNCEENMVNQPYGSNNTKYNYAEWIGMQKADKGQLPYLLRGYIGIVTVTTLRAIILVRQMFFRHQNGQPLDTPFVMFPHISRKEADIGLPECFKFLLNYGFYKFGLEICLVGIVTLIGTRLDFYSVLYAIWLAILFTLSRRSTARIWPIFTLFNIVLLPTQYFLVVAPPTSLCIQYPWGAHEWLRRLQEWMYLPDPDFPPNPKKLVCDFILLMMVVRQSLVFRIERRADETDKPFIAGHNYSVSHETENPNFVNPMKDFVSHIHSWLDVAKRGCLLSLMWITLSIMFLAGTKRTNLFSLGYLIGAFVFLWQGSDFYLRPPKTILKWWNMLIAYNITVIFMKALLQGIGCVVITHLQEQACWLVQLLGIGCLKKFRSSSSDLLGASECEVATEDIGMVWDGLCFGFLIMQKRLFRSYYFSHIVDETKAMSILASRGAELLEELHKKRIECQETTEKNVLQKLKFKMDKIKANQQKIQGTSFREPETHHIEGAAPLARSPSVSSCVSSGHTPPQGYQTPIDEDEPPPLTPRAASLLQAPTPNSAIMTVSLEGYLEPMRISFGSPPSSELNPRGPSPDESFPVFSPPPYDQPPPDQPAPTTRHRRQSSFIGPPWMNGLQTPRQSIISTTSRSPHSHHTYTIYPGTRPLYKRHAPKTNREAVRSGDYYMFDDLDDDDITELSPDEEEEEAEWRQKVEVRGRRMTVAELVTTLFKTDIEIATHVALQGGTPKDALELRRRSLPMTRKKSSMSYLSARSETETAAPIDEQASMNSAEVEEVEEEIREEDLTKSPVPSEDISLPRKSVSCFTYFKFIWAFITSSMVSLTRYLNQFSRDYRYIRKVLAKEKKILKEKPDFRMGTRLGINQIWQPIPIVKQRSSTEDSTDDPSEEGAGPSQPRHLGDRKESSLTVPHIRILAPSLERGLDMSSSSSIYSRLSREPDDDAELSEIDQPPIIQLAAAIWFGILAHSTLLCYFMVFLHQIKNASVLSLPLPLMVFLWGSLTIPRPSKTFWVTLIAYTEVIVIVKCMFQLELIPWNRKVPLSTPFYAPRIIGVMRKQNYALYDLLLLLIVFFHRFMLKSLGQWTTPASKPRKIIPTKLTLGKTDETPPANWGQGEQMPTQPMQTNSEENKRRGTIDFTTPRGRAVSLLSKIGDAEPAFDEISHNGNDKIVLVQADEMDPCDEKLTKTIGMTALRYMEPMKLFFKTILGDTGKEKTNVYAYMFLCDFFNFLLIIFGFSSFGTQQGDGGVTAYFSENRVPMPFLLMLLLQFALIVIDRALFLRKYILGKLIFQYFLVLGVHIWMFFILPGVTERQFNENLPPQIWYMVKCFYLLLAAYQLRLGYPTRILGNFLCKKYTVVNVVLFKVFMLVPLLFELRAVMDWIWTDTSMTIMDWFKMEDIFASIYQIKCMRGVETDYPQARGRKKSQLSKSFVGGAALFAMIGLIWFPLLLFALGGTVGESNLPYEVSMKIRIGSYEPIYSMSAQNSSIVSFNEEEFNNLTRYYARDKSATTFLENYIYSDVAAVKLSESSRKLWAISPPDRARLKKELESNSIVTVHVEWTVSRKTDAKDSNGITSTIRDIRLLPIVDGKPNKMRQTLVQMLNGTATDTTTVALLSSAFPKFLKVTSRITDVVPQLMHRQEFLPSDTENTDYLYRDVSVQLSRDSIDCCVQQQWWTVREMCTDEIHNGLLKNIPKNDCRYIMMFLFNDKAFPKGLSFISGFGILGLYTTAVIVLSQVIRKVVSEMAPKIMFEDLPYVDRILRLCLDIYLVRESGELCLEEDLFAKLIFLYRSPETLIRWTRPPEIGEEDDNDDDDENDDDVDQGGGNNGMRHA